MQRPLITIVVEYAQLVFLILLQTQSMPSYKCAEQILREIQTIQTIRSFDKTNNSP